jgi:hypothetical protein
MLLMWKQVGFDILIVYFDKLQIGDIFSFLTSFSFIS